MMGIIYCEPCQEFHDTDWTEIEESMVNGEPICLDAYYDEVSLRDALWGLWPPTKVPQESEKADDARISSRDAMIELLQIRLERNAVAKRSLSVMYENVRDENRRLLEAAQTIWRRSEKMSPLDNTWVQNVLAEALEAE